MNFQPGARGHFCIIHKEIKKNRNNTFAAHLQSFLSLNSFFLAAADYLLAYNHAIKIACKIESRQLAFVRRFSELYGSAKNENILVWCVHSIKSILLA
jgi:hypothetical protein